MDHKTTWLVGKRADDPFERALAEIDAAILLVQAGVATVVTLCCFDGVEAAAYTGVAWTQAAGVAFRLRREGSISLVIGPRLPIAPRGLES